MNGGGGGGYISHETLFDVNEKATATGVMQIDKQTLEISTPDLHTIITATA